jgi:hypothetical protein
MKLIIYYDIIMNMHSVDKQVTQFCITPLQTSTL